MDTYGVATPDLISVRRSGIRLFRDATYPVLRGTSLTFDDASGLVYLRGSVPQFRTCLGMYIPSSLEYQLAYGEVDPAQIARELMALSKLNFTSTQFITWRRAVSPGRRTTRFVEWWRRRCPTSGCSLRDPRRAPQ